MRIANQLNSEIPMSAFVVEDSQLSLRCRVNVSSTGRTLLRVISAAVLLHAYYAMAARVVVSSNHNKGLISLVDDGHAGQEGEEPVSKSLLKAILLRNDPWLLDRWPAIKPHLTAIMLEFGFTKGWGDEEVQFFNEVPPDLAVAVLDPERARFASLGRGVLMQARVIPPGSHLESLTPETVNDLNLAMFATGRSVLGGFSSIDAVVSGLMVDLWVPVDGVVAKSQDAAMNGTCLANLAVHAAGAPFAAVAPFLGK